VNQTSASVNSQARSQAYAFDNKKMGAGSPPPDPSGYIPLGIFSCFLPFVLIATGAMACATPSLGWLFAIRA
jgi:hypothetical protein